MLPSEAVEATLCLPVECLPPPIPIPTDPRRESTVVHRLRLWGADLAWIDVRLRFRCLSLRRSVIDVILADDQSAVRTVSFTTVCDDPPLAFRARRVRVECLASRFVEPSLVAIAYVHRLSCEARILAPRTRQGRA
jgi:hypothetical protein